MVGGTFMMNMMTSQADLYETDIWGFTFDDGDTVDDIKDSDDLFDIEPSQILRLPST